MFGARLDVSGEEIPGIKDLLYRSGSLQLKHIIHVAGPDFKNVEAVSILLKVKSVRVIKRFLDKLQGALNLQETFYLRSTKRNVYSQIVEIFFQIYVLYLILSH